MTVNRSLVSSGHQTQEAQKTLLAQDPMWRQPVPLQLPDLLNGFSAGAILRLTKVDRERKEGKKNLTLLSLPGLIYSLFTFFRKLWNRSVKWESSEIEQDSASFCQVTSSLCCPLLLPRLFSSVRSLWQAHRDPLLGRTTWISFQKVQILYSVASCFYGVHESCQAEWVSQLWD